jgi:hypothetical protein
VEGEAEGMFKIKVLLLGLLAVFAVSSMASTTASALLQGPWWLKQIEGKQVKIEQKEELQIKSSKIGTAPFKIVSPLGGGTEIKCEKVENKGWIWNGVKQGQDKEELKFTECTDVYVNCPFVRTATLGQAKVVSELMWKYRGIPGELTEQGTQEIYDVFAPRAKIEEFAPNRFRSAFLRVKVPAFETCPAEEFELVAEGSKRKWQDQNIDPKTGQHETIEVVWGTAARVEPENKDQKVVTLNWLRPNVKVLHHQEVVNEALLQLGGAEAEIEGMLGLQDEFDKVEFGAWDKIQ